MGLFEKFNANLNNGVMGKSSQERTNQDNLPANQVANKKLEDRDIDKQYDFRGGMKSALRGDNNLGFDQPFVVRDIGDSYPSIRDGIFRGGLPLQIVRAAEDVTRISKFLLTPNGVLWGLKQALLQNMNSREETRKFNVIKDLASIAPTVHTERHADTFGPPLVIPETPEQLTALGESFNSRGYEDVIRDSDGKKGLGEVLENSTPKPKRNTPTIGDQVAAAFGFGGSDKELPKASDFDLGSGRIKTMPDGKTLFANTVSNMLQVPYGGKFGDTNTTDGTNPLPKDFIKFQIRDAVNGKWLIFPAHLGTITDTVTPSYAQEYYIGRPDAVHIYQNTSRAVAFDFKVAAFTKQEIPLIQEKMNYLIGLGYPHYKGFFEGDGEKRPVTPYIYLTIGDLFNKTPGYFDSISCTIEEGATWEIDDGLQIPQVWNVSVNFVYIGKRLPHSLTKHYEVPHLEDEGLSGDNFGTFEGDPTDPDNISPDRSQESSKWANGLN
mgnify:CR=1 FL=1|tara:strand:+ start:1475 stop:2956 length:1482 start_codon:yes stop_codon:yes gene_type:complete